MDDPTVPREIFNRWFVFARELAQKFSTGEPLTDDERQKWENLRDLQILEPAPDKSPIELTGDLPDERTL
jgi:hypothetical protein